MVIAGLYFKTNHHWVILVRVDELFSALKQYFALSNDKFHNYINRMPVAVRRIAGVLTTLRYWEQKKLTPAEMYATDEDWDWSIQLVLNNIPTLYKTYKNPYINKESEVTRVQETIDILAKLPEIFTYKEFVNVCNENGISTRSADRNIQYLKRNNYIAKHGYKKGVFKKVKNS